MKITYLASIALVSIGSAQSSGLAEYRELCSGSVKTGETTLSNGIKAHFKCDVKVPNALAESEVIAESAAACVAKCGTDCASVVWQYSKSRCQLYSSPVNPSATSRGTVYLLPIRTPTSSEGEDGEESDCQSERLSCEDELSAVQQEGAQCAANNAALALQIASLEAQLSGCIKPPTCDAAKTSNNQEISSGSRKYKIYCDRIDHGVGTNDLGNAIAVSDLDECIAKCNALPRCERAIVTPNGKTCYLRSYGKDLIPTAPGYHSAHLV